MAKEFEEIELIIRRSGKWLKRYRKRHFYLSETFPLKYFNLPKNLNYLEEKHIPLLRAILKRHWETFWINVLKELRENPLEA